VRGKNLVHTFLTSHLQVIKNASSHEDVSWTRQKHAMSVSQWYADKYPGTHPSAHPGPRH